MKNFKVLVTTSGLGSRLGNQTKYMNKALLRIGNKPVIAHIIDSYPPDTEFVITLGYHGDYVKQFIQIAYPARSFSFVDISPFKGAGSSLLFSLYEAKDYLDCPFIFHASDTLVDKIKVSNLKRNTIYGSTGTESSMYASLNVTNGKVNKIFSKGELNPDFLHIGLVYISNYKEFWSSAKNILSKQSNNQSVGDVDVIHDLLTSFKISFDFIQVGKWFDTGSVSGLKAAKMGFENSDLHVLDKLKESIYMIDNHVIKFFTDKNLNQSRIQRAALLGDAVPAIVSSSDNFFKYEYVKGSLMSKAFDSGIVIELLDWAKNNLWLENPENIDFHETCLTFYKTKTLERVGDFLNANSFEVEPYIINGLHTESIYDLLEKVDYNDLADTKNLVFHGDFILDNILVDNKEFKLIDWRQDFAGQINAGDMYYDLAKFAHNLVVNHEIIDKDLYHVRVSGGKVELNINRFNTLVEFEEVFYKWIVTNNLDVQRVKLLRALIWLNMSPLHHYPFNNFLFFFGKYHLQKALSHDN